ncbi:hypothetical protein PFICI_13088 [Pestalotiopsis fici W106-1]|uniref:RlpA-like protein double-psi beta-barrel domain-containing protein n=1 Tax=Pestalotiopsis fici (strain W106-1 / CGMCC3.15140) TaxID=1229662 RepID=W3WLF8_PESFW|nr:uncharacterized protein PFICI_13088 [Pestalotiopsis fici W106-1]ETS74604.1 hypothetical protein PFICI_13088 [Pestalotiopsis fici W106-1]
MKSAAVALFTLASAAIAQPHGHARRHHHDKRDLVVEWVTEVETVTVEVDETTTQTFYPAKTEEAAATTVATSSGSPGEFFQAAASTSIYSAAAPSTTLVVKPSTQQTTEAAPATSSSSYSTSSSTSTTPIVVVPTVVLPTTTAEAPTTTAAAETTTYAAEPTSTTAAAATTGSGSSSGTNVKNSDMTYYAIGLGSCGYDDSGLDLTKPVVAIDYHLWDSVSTLTSYGVDLPAHPFCNQEITIKYNGQTTTGIVRDRCGGCVENAIDVAETIFDDLVGGTTAGRVEVEWYFNSGEW